MGYTSVRFWAYKNAIQTKANQQNKNKRTKNSKGKQFFAHKNFCEGENWLFCALMLFVRSKSFRKKNKLAENCLDSLIYSTTSCNKQIKFQEINWLKINLCLSICERFHYMVNKLQCQSFIGIKTWGLLNCFVNNVYWITT